MNRTRNLKLITSALKNDLRSASSAGTASIKRATGEKRQKWPIKKTSLCPKMGRCSHQERGEETQEEIAKKTREPTPGKPNMKAQVACAQKDSGRVNLSVTTGVGLGRLCELQRAKSQASGGQTGVGFGLGRALSR